MGDFIRLQGGYAFKSELFRNNGIPIIRISNLPQDGDEVDLTECVYYDNGEYDNYVVNKGDLLIAMSGATTGKTATYRSDERAFLNQRVGCFRAQIEFHYPFIYGIVESPSFQNSLKKKLIAGAQPNISSSDIETIPFFFPSINEQVRIADLISLINQRISIQSKIIEDYKKLKDAVENRCFGYAQGEPTRLGSILCERLEKSVQNNQFEVLSSTVCGIYIQREYFNKDIASADNTGYKVIRRGDIVFSPQNLWMGNINYNDFFEVGIVSPSYKVFSIRPLFDSDYIAFLLKSPKALWEYALVSEQGASIVRRNLNIDSFLKISFLIPKIKEQKRIGNTLSSINRRIKLEGKCMDYLNRQKQFLLQNLFI